MVFWGDVFGDPVFPGSPQGCFTDPRPLYTFSCCVSMTSLKTKPAHPEKQLCGAPERRHRLLWPVWEAGLLLLLPKAQAALSAEPLLLCGLASGFDCLRPE